MEFSLKPLSLQSMGRALGHAQNYRLLNEPEQAESICRDILRLAPDHAQASLLLVLSLTDQFKTRLGGRIKRALKALERIQDPYANLYYHGVILERVARAKLTHTTPGSKFSAYAHFREAMKWYEKAEKIRPPENDDSILRWNACVRTIRARKLRPSPDDTFLPLLE